MAGFFKDYYFSEHNQGNLNSFEEAPFAYFSQINNWFEALPIAFNTQILYKIKGTEKGNKIENAEKRFRNFSEGIITKKQGIAFIPRKNTGNMLKRS